MRNQRPRFSSAAGIPSLLVSPLLLVSALLLIAPERAAAFEADVHYGLTHWLALQAGFEPLQAQIIATGDERVDSGDMPYIDLVAMYACLHKDEVSARRAGEHMGVLLYAMPCALPSAIVGEVRGPFTIPTAAVKMYAPRLAPLLQAHHITQCLSRVSVPVYG